MIEKPKNETRQVDVAMTGDAKAIMRALSRLKACVQGGVLPILSCIAIREDAAGRVVADATNLSQARRGVLPVDVQGGTIPSEWGACVPYAPLMALLGRANGDGEVTFAFGGGLLEISGGDRQATLLTLPIKDFPEISSSKEHVEFDSEGLAQALRRVAYAASLDETRYVLNGVFIDIEKGVAVATEGKRLQSREWQMPEGVSEGAIIIPTAGCQLICEMVDGSKDNDILRIGTHRGGKANGLEITSSTGERLWTPLIEGNFPRYQQVIPNYASPISLWVDRAELLSALRWCEVYAQEELGHLIGVSCDGRVMRLEVFNPDRGDAHVQLALTKDVELADDVRFGLSAVLFRQMVDHIAGEVVEIQVEAPGSLTGPIIFPEPEGLGVLMPMRSPVSAG